MNERGNYDRVIGSCFGCGGPVRRSNVVSILDPTVDILRKLHRGLCEDRFRVMLGAKVEGTKP